MPYKTHIPINQKENSVNGAYIALRISQSKNEAYSVAFSSDFIKENKLQEFKYATVMTDSKNSKIAFNFNNENGSKLSADGGKKNERTNSRSITITSLVSDKEFKFLVDFLRKNKSTRFKAAKIKDQDTWEFKVSG